ncbi:Phage integrase family protein [Fibrobacter sp. UWB10]|nr:Phage integrase family protein [Fibrobacter sp. UWB10]
MLLKLISSFCEDRRKTLRERFKGLKMWLVWCRDNYELADFEPWHNVKLKQLPPEPEKEFWTMPQIEAILNACPTDLYRLFLGLMAYAGLRMSEALYMRWEDFAPDLSEFALVGKMDKFAKMPISDKLRCLIEKVRPKNLEGRLFAEGKFPQKSWELMPLLKTVVMSAGLNAPGRIGHHKLRHSFATNLLRSQVDIKTVSTALRHAKVSTTLDIYVHTVDESVKDALEKL